MKLKQHLGFQFLALCFLLMGLQVSAKDTAHTPDLFSTNQQQDKIASSHFHHSLFVEELSPISSIAEKNVNTGSYPYFLNPSKFAGLTDSTILIILQGFMLQDKRSRVLRELFPFHFFF